MEILGLILARGGSKSLPKKNIYPLVGVPLLVYTVEAAKHAKSVTRLIISTDDDEIADVAQNAGAEVPFMRPAALAEDLTPDFPVFEHALAWLKDNEGYVPDAVVHLRPTAPLRASRDIDDCVSQLMANDDADSIRSVCEPDHTPFTMYYLEKGNPFMQPLLKKVFTETYKKYPEAHSMPRQALPKVWFHIGDTDVIRTKTLTEKKSMTGNNILPFFQEVWRNVDIDSLEHMRQAEALIEKLRKEGKKPWQK